MWHVSKYSKVPSDSFCNDGSHAVMMSTEL